MSDDFEQALAAKLSRNAELHEERAQAEEEMDRAQREAAERAAAERQRDQKDRDERHAALVDALQPAAQRLKDARPEEFVVRLGWTDSREEFIVKISTRTVEPARSLFIELDHDDDEVLVRWHSDLGDALELWRLLEATPEMLHELVLQVADHELWRSLDRPPPFPEGAQPAEGGAEWGS
jgi:hypothetical protein